MARPSPEYSLMLKAKMQSPFRFAVGLGNDSVGYILEPQSIENDQQSTFRLRVNDGSGSRVGSVRMAGK